jgi:hypothetical protein
VSNRAGGYDPLAMEQQIHRDGGAPAAARLSPNRLAALLLLVLLAWHGWMTFALLCPQRQWQCLLDDRSIISGSHPLHLYHGWLGAQSFYQRGTLCCYDPAFEAGYPKTPVFDSGSRPAELFQIAAGGQFSPAAYKLGLALCCMSVPFLLLAGAFGLGFHRGARCLVVAFGLLIWWGSPCQTAVERGDIDFLMGALGSVASIGLLILYDRRPGVGCWLSLVAIWCFTWFSHQVLAILVLPLFLVYYLSIGARHGFGWHVALLIGFAGALAVNSFWLPHWFEAWWIHLPLQFDPSTPVHRTLHTFWRADLWGDSSDRLLAAALMILAVLGVVTLNQGHRRAAARMLGLGAGGFLVIALTGIAWRPLGRLGTTPLYLVGLWFAVLPAVYVLGQLFALSSRWLAPFAKMLILAAGICAGVAVCGYELATGRGLHWLCPASLAVGLNPQQQALVESIISHTTPEARILWEECTSEEDGSRWPVLLPVLTKRAYIGGLGPDVSIEHAHARLIDRALAGRPLREWSNAELNEFCRRYNIGWAACWSAETAARFERWPAAKLLTTLPGDIPGRLFEFQPRSFVLKGEARILSADCQRIALADVVPEDGKVVLSFHYQAGLQASPGRVQVEREPDSHDPVPFIRLRVPEPVSRLTLMWEGR